jgi:ABC-type transport system involved in multi-copper enzyme maturation permease subunit
MIGDWLTQIAAVVRLEMKKTFFSKRGIWVYLLALAPAAIYLMYSLSEIANHEQRQQLAAAHPVSIGTLKAIKTGMTIDEVVQRAGEPYSRREFNQFRFGNGKNKGKGDKDKAAPVNQQIVFMQYTDGDSIFNFNFVDGSLVGINERDRSTIPKDSLIFATVFQFFYLRLAVFFGCVGVFANLFRGEMLDKSLHFYLLTPVRREVLAIGKYIAGLTATVVIFTTSTFLQLAALAWHFSRQEVSEYLNGPGWGHVAAYLGVTALACVGYGSVFLAVGLLFRNPIVPAAALLIWESANLYLPATLKKISVIFYLQSLSPVVAPPDADLPSLLKLLITAAEPVSASVAILGLLGVSAAVLVLACWQARRLEINYSAD